METILVVAEGVKAESKIIDNIKKVFLDNKVIIKILYGTSIYGFYKKKKSYGDDFETVEVLREMSDKNRNDLKNIKRHHISSIFLFFDQDSHTTNYSKDKLEEMLNFFDDEYEQGKLFISYPMVESIRDISNLDEKYTEDMCIWDINKNKKYKEYASKTIKNISHMSVYENYDINIWRIISRYNWIKANLLINNIFSLPCYDELINFSQKMIFIKEYILMENGKVITLNAFPFFLVYYFNKQFIENNFY